MLTLLFALPPALVASDGDLDLTFSDDGYEIVGWGGAALHRAPATAVAALADGSLLVGGEVEGSDGDTDFGVVKLLANGAIDTGWAGSGRIRVEVDATPNTDDWLRSIAVLPDGSALLAGLSIVEDPDEFLQLPAVVRLTPGGAPDGDFGVAGVVVVGLPWPTTDYGFSNPIHQPDGKVLFTGYCYGCSDTTSNGRPVVLRLTVDGEPDPTFSGDGWWVGPSVALDDFYPHNLAVDGAGRILVYGSSGDPGVVRLTTAGQLDTTFGGGDGFVTWPRPTGYANPHTFAVDRNSGAMYVGHRIATGDGVNFTALSRLHANGTFDATFAGDGRAELAFRDQVSVSSLLVQSDGKVVAAGMTRSTGSDQDPILFRLLANGTLDDSFDSNGIQALDFGQDPDGSDRAEALTLSAGRLVMIGQVEVNATPRFGIARLVSALIFADGFERGSTGGWSGN
jgi:uncharacterized delta-60 repeat protein